jgi:hypothetical protein
MIILRCTHCDEDLAVEASYYDHDAEAFVLVVNTGCECQDSAYVDGMHDERHEEEEEDEDS